MAKSTPYSDRELRDTITLYFQFLEADRAGTKIGKNSNYKALAAKHGVRKWTSYMSKCQNISAIMITLGLPYASGLKPRGGAGKENSGSKLRLLITGIATERGLI